MIGRTVRGVWKLFGGKSHKRDFQIGRAAAADLYTAARRPETRPDGFEDCVLAYGLSDRDLSRLHRQHAWQCYVFSGGGVFAATFGATSALAHSGALIGMLALLLALLFFARAAQHSLRAWQIRERRLGAFGEWLRRPGVWFPPFLFARAP